MARIRTIKPEFWGHPKVVAVSRDARLLFLGLLNEADDEGRMRYSAKRVAGVVFPEDGDVTAKKIDRWVKELERAGLVVLYLVDGGVVLSIPGFSEHQRINRATPSRLPPPPFTAPSVSAAGGLAEGSPPEGNREEEQGREEEHESAAPTRSERDAMFDAVRAEYGGPESRGSLIAKCAGEILEQGGTPEEVPSRAAECRRRFPSGGPRALSMHWHELGQIQAPGWAEGLQAAAEAEDTREIVRDWDEARALEVGG